MLPPFPFCPMPLDSGQTWRQYQSHKLRLLISCRDAAERRLAALNAAINTLEQQIARDQDVSRP